MRQPILSPKLDWIAEKAKEDKDFQFQTLAYLIDENLLLYAYEGIRKNAASGVDKMTAEEYENGLYGRLKDLHNRLKSGKYVAPAVKRVWIPKEDGKQRPIGIPTLEDKIVQSAVKIVLERVYEQDFYDFSYGFRPGRSAHDALRSLWQSSINQNAGWIIDADITGFFDNLTHGILKDLLHQRVKDGGIDRLIGKWLNAGILDGEQLTYPDKGTPQGGVISPLLANIYLHYVLDEWFEKEIKPRMNGNCFLIRYADDFVIGFELKSDAKRVYEVLPKRFEKYGLSIHSDKTRLIRFKRPFGDEDKDNETFDFLGFTHYWDKTRKGGWIIKRRTSRKRMRRTLSRIGQWCKHNRHMAVKEQYKKLCEKLQGHYQYFGIRCNYDSVFRVYWETLVQWHKWLSRRSQKGHLTWEKFHRILETYPLPMPRIIQKSV